MAGRIASCGRGGWCVRKRGARLQFSKVKSVSAPYGSASTHRSSRARAKERGALVQSACSARARGAWRSAGGACVGCELHTGYSPSESSRLSRPPAGDARAGGVHRCAARVAVATGAYLGATHRRRDSRVPRPRGRAGDSSSSTCSGRFARGVGGSRGHPIQSDLRGLGARSVRRATCTRGIREGPQSARAMI